ncbi:glycosyltransferase involved in cell wall biosynthesis [Trinickia symbiotica]|uniref:Glycosyl transferase family 1 n=1 Tax=Trinickia symbiotica TaxID=863227 RepID=A0A2N7X080_9BURK|nr:glycosyltransferase family 4 protein [Trinickia symbiotica]PMS35040.1 glycosyl transferase family 1 [Trinickia symbiotica]PPK43539.1 glycosyltransferase involved in cell wall biosynthesis [Trinickia symbiotica]
MQRYRVLVINDFVQKGGADVVYRQSAELLSAMPGVEVQCFDESRFHGSSSLLAKSWNLAAARALEQALIRYRPHRILVHNYHNALSASVLGVIARYKRKLGYTAYLTCHDYHLVYYNPTLHYRVSGHIEQVTLDELGTWRMLRLRASAKGVVHDIFTKAYWHAIRILYKPERIFDRILCPSDFMQQALHRRGIDNTVVLYNPSALSVASKPVSVCNRERFNLAFVGRIAYEKGLEQFIELAHSIDFARIECLGVFGDGPDRVAIEQRYASLVEKGKLIFFGRLPHDRLFSALRGFADAIVLPSVGTEIAPLVIVEAAMLGLPTLIREGNYRFTFGDTVGSKIAYHDDAQSLRAALDELAAHLARADRTYHVSDFLPHRYAERLVRVMQIDVPPIRGDGQP